MLKSVPIPGLIINSLNTNEANMGMGQKKKSLMSIQKFFMFKRLKACVITRRLFFSSKYIS